MNTTNQHYDTLQLSVQIIKEKNWNGIRHFTLLSLSSIFAAVMYFFPIPLEGNESRELSVEIQILFPLVVLCLMVLLRRTNESFQSSLKEDISQDYKVDMKNYTIAMMIFQFSVMMSLLYSIMDEYDEYDCTRMGIALTIRSLLTLILVHRLWKTGVLTDVMSMVYLVYFSLVDLYGALHILVQNPQWYNFTDFEYTTLFRAHQIISVFLMIQYCVHIDQIKDHQKGIFNLGSRVFIAVLIPRSLCNGYEHNGDGFENENLLFFVYLPILFLIGILRDRTFFLFTSLAISLIVNIQGLDGLSFLEMYFDEFLNFTFYMGFTVLNGAAIVNKSFVKTYAVSLCKQLEAKARGLIGLNPARVKRRDDLNEPLIQVI